MESTKSNPLPTLAILIIVSIAGRSVYQRFKSNKAPASVALPTASATVATTSQPTADATEAPTEPDQSIEDKVATNPVESLISLGFGVAHSVSRAGNDMFDELAGLDAVEEMEVGREAWEETQDQLTLVDDTVMQSRLERLAAPFLANLGRPEIKYHFAIVDDDSVNAFAHLGGYIYVNTGLLQRAQNDDELQFVLGHEIAHVDRRHCVKNMTATIRAEQAVGGMGGSLASLAYQAISVGYSEEFELEADRWSYQQMRSHGSTHGSALSGLKMLEREFGADGDQHAHGPLIVKQLQDHFRSHPRIADRITQLNRL
ncbi:MAG: M48 family metalloprotease [Planctomycetales bacterium]|nr:M48 family metalloprotease [Planctomycetales bacterium]